MSTSNSAPTTVKCKGPDCDTTGYHGHFHHGEYCSERCAYRHAGADLLKSIKRDHCRCFTCFRQLKQIEEPPEYKNLDYSDGAYTYDEDGSVTYQRISQEVTFRALCGFQYRTEHATTGEIQHGDQIVTGTICDNCGATDHADHEPTLAGGAAIERLFALLVTEEDVHLDADSRAVDDGDTILDTEAFAWAYAVSGDPLLATGWALADD